MHYYSRLVVVDRIGKNMSERMMRRKDAPNRSVTEIGSGDYVKVGSRWERVVSNSDHGAAQPQRDGNWRITTESGRTITGWSANRYAKAEDMEPRQLRFT